MSKEQIECDVNKLRIIFLKKGIKLTDLAEEIGYTRGYFRDAGNVKRARHTISRVASNYIGKVYKVSPEQYALDKVEKKPTPKNDLITRGDFKEVTTDELYRTIYTAVYHAVKVALSSYFEEIERRKENK